MTDENIFIPRILLCGDKAEFFSRVGQRLFDLVGEIKFFDEQSGRNFLRDRKVLLNGVLIWHEELINKLRGGG